MCQRDSRVRRRTAYARATRWLLVLLCLVAQRAPEVSRAFVRFEETSSPDSVRSSSTLRLGTAATPFGWATATGDLNFDGTPDHAVADRLGRDASGFAYELEFSLTGVGSQSVRFESPDGALDVSLRDVDHDNDLDVVVSAVFSSEPERVWLNDGAGRFQEADAHQLPREPRLATSSAAGDDAPDRAGAGPVPRRSADGLEADAASRSGLAPRDGVHLLRLIPALAPATSPRRSRSPPSAGRSLA